ncbi:hypothetical protein [Streptomyces turgidiscabies]|uniref:hypothetical protein n=1 Tax=Streptomyces turgidiscabies TaxID=85558 RepID=UPI0038F78C3E
MSTLRPATLDEYLAWLRAWLDTGQQPTHAYDYPWSRWTWLTATQDFTLGGESGSNAVHIIVPAGIQHARGGLGHNQLYYLDGPEQHGRVVPVFSDPQFQTLSGVPEFVREEQRKVAAWHSERKAEEAARKQAAEGSDVPSRY